MKNVKRVLVCMLLCVLMVCMVPVGVASAADEHDQEWNNFAEYCGYNGIDMETLPIEYDENKLYWYCVMSNYVYILVWDNSVTKYCHSGASSSSSFYFCWDNCDAVYKSTDYGETWNNVLGSDTYLNYKINDINVKYSDISYSFTLSYFSVFQSVTKTGQYVAFEDAIATMSSSVKTKLQGYDYYVVATVPVRTNKWYSEQIMIACSNANKVILRDEAYNKIYFTTGTGYEAGITYVFDSHTMTWYSYNTAKAYVIGSSLATGGSEPTVLYTNCDIYYEDGTSYGLTDEVWCSARPYGEVTPTPVPTEQEVVTEGFPYLFEVTDNLAYVYESADASSASIVMLGKGRSGCITGVVYDSSGAAWYKVSVVSNNTEYVGYVLASSVYVGSSISGDPVTEIYTFEDWCADADLNCSASSNESTSVIPFWYGENYIYIARIDDSKEIYCTMIQNSASSPVYPYFDGSTTNGDYVGKIGLWTDYDTSDGFVFTVRNFIYDTDGWKLTSKQDLNITVDSPLSDIDCILDGTRKLLYNSADIFTTSTGTAVLQAASTEFDDTYFGGIDIIAPTPTPGGSGSSSNIGSGAASGGALDFIVTLFSMIWTRLFAIEMNVDGFQISFQQIIIYGILVSIVGAFLIKLIFGSKT